MGRLEGKTAVITGAASGMGRATALLFAREGARLLVADVDERGGEQVAEEIRGGGGKATFRRVDVSRSAEVEAMIGAAAEEFGALDVLFNNAGIEGESARVADSSEENFDRVIAVNLKGVFLGMKYGLPVMAGQGRGSVINTASVAGLVGWYGANAYSAAKGGVVTLTKTAALEYARYGVRVNCICPGVIRTAMVERITGGTDEAMERLRRMQPFPRLGSAEDIARMALFLASDESEFVTGAAMTVDGGLTAR
ncbi:MAG: glucose 1-dehydrogenase [Chloroflexi bacterium]|nr:glucose 1-dehydrogenase [Chloroflexota bacterium]